MTEHEEPPREGPSERWQGYAAIAAVVMALGGLVWNQAQSATTLSNHTTQIQGIETTEQNEQVMLSSINQQLAGLTQEIADMRQEKGHQ